MSTANGHVPEGATIATLEMLRKANTALRKAPRLSEQIGQDVYVRIRAIRAVVYQEAMPPQPIEAVEWPKDGKDREAAVQRWFDGLPEAERESRRAILHQVAFKIVAAGLIDPRVTVETAGDFAADADYLADEILVFSGILKPKAEPIAEVAAVS